MLKPTVTKYVDTVPNGKGKFKMIARIGIPGNTVIEICPVVSISGRVALLLSKTNPKLSEKIMIDNRVIEREFQVFAQLGELELERRLDAGEISQSEYQSILRSKVNINSILDAQSNLIPLGNGLLYEQSDYPNLVREYDEESRVCIFRTVQEVEQGQELTYFK